VHTAGRRRAGRGSLPRPACAHPVITPFPSAESAAAWVAGLLSSGRIRDVTLVGPAPAPIDRIRGRWRWHFLLRAEGAKTLGKVSRYFYERWRAPTSKAADIRVIIDRDPVQLL